MSTRSGVARVGAQPRHCGISDLAAFQRFKKRTQMAVALMRRARSNT